MADKYNDINFRFLGDAKDLDAATRKANTALGKTDREAGKAKAAFGNLNTAVGGFIATVGAREVLQFAQDSAELAMQANAAGESAEKVLGPALETVHANLDGVRQAMGLSVLDLDTIIAQYGLLTEQYFETDEAQAAFIEDLVRMGGDLAAFKGDVSQTPEAVAAFGAALRGEFDPLEQFGVKLSEAAIQEEILRQKADPLNESLSDQELRIAAIQELIDQKAEPAIGALSDAMERGDTKANELNSRVEDLQIELGEKLQPALEGVLDFLLSVIDGWENLTTDFDNTRLGVWVDKLEPVGAVLGWIGDNLLNISAALDTVRGAWDKVKGFWNTVTSGIGSAAKWIGAIPGFAKGGTVPGPKGAPRMIMAHGGERVVNDDTGGGGGGATYSIHVTAGVGDANEIARQIVEALQVYNQTNGAIPVTVRSTE